MRKYLAMLAGLLLLVASVFAVNLEMPKRNHNGVADHLYVTEKDNMFPCTGEQVWGVDCWTPVENGAWGKLTYLDDGTYVFNGHSLVEGATYKLIAYNEATYKGVVIESGVANEVGDLHLAGDLPELPVYSYTSGEYAGQEGSKIWLIPSNGIYSTGYINWGLISTFLLEMELV